MPPKPGSYIILEDDDELAQPSRPTGRPPRKPQITNQPTDQQPTDQQPIESDEDQPIVVNAEEFARRENLKASEGAVGRERSQSPPRRTLRAQDDEVVYRDRTGRRVTREEWLLANRRNNLPGIGGRVEIERQETTWGKGLVQIEESRRRAEEERKTGQAPLNSDIDEAYEKELRERRRWADPMGREGNRAEDRPKCRFVGVPNRFDIAPGYRWDGVVRGNGYEARWFKHLADRERRKREGYLNNIADI